MWTQGNYRRLFLDMHIDDSDEAYFSKLDPDKIFETLKETGTQMITVKGITHTGLAHYPSETGRTHKGLRGIDYVGRMTELAHQNGIAVMGYFSQIFDNWAYEHHPSWRQINAEGKGSRDYEDYDNLSMFRRGRYGIVCPNNLEYREEVRRCLTEMNSRYKFDTIFLDMAFWPEICHCASCRERYYRETGREIPTKVDWDDPAFIDFARRRDEWMAEFTALSIEAVKAANPACTCELNVGGAPCSMWVGATSDRLAEQCEYVGGDLYGGYLEESFICKYSRNLSRTLPFVYHTSRCDPDLYAHTTTRTWEEFLQYGIISLVHNGAFAVCDGINPDGTLCESAYKTIAKAFRELEPYAPYINGNYESDVTIWVPSDSRFDRTQTGMDIQDARVWGYGEYMDAKVKLAHILRMDHIPFDVLPSKKLGEIPNRVLAVSSVARIRDDEMQHIERHLQNGGTVYLTGRPGHPRLLELLEAEYLGQTEHNVTYMAPTGAGIPLFGDFTAADPLAVPGTQAKMRFAGEIEPLATLVLPYTMTGKKEFSSIHSNPPGIYTDFVSMARKRVGKGTILWVAAPIELARSYMNRQVVARLMRSLCGGLKYEVAASPFVEVLTWKKDGKRYFSAVNEQESMPFTPAGRVEIRTPYPVTSARVLGGGTVEVSKDGSGSRLCVPETGMFCILETETAE